MGPLFYIQEQTMGNLYSFESGDKPAIIRVSEDGRILGRRYWNSEEQSLGDEQRVRGEPKYNGPLWASKYEALQVLQALLN
jgi:hypothetical protein